MNKIEKSIVDGLNNVTSRKGNWKLFASRKVSASMKLNEKESKVYNALSEYLLDNDTSICVLPTTKFTTMLLDWTNEKLIELPSVLVDIKTLEKCLKYYWLENHLKLHRYFAIAMNENDDKLYIVSVCCESGIYQLKDTSDKTSENASENDDENATNENDTMSKIAKHISDIVRLSKDFATSDKLEIVNQLSSMLKVDVKSTSVKVAKRA